MNSLFYKFIFFTLLIQYVYCGCFNVKLTLPDKNYNLGKLNTNGTSHNTIKNSLKNIPKKYDINLYASDGTILLCNKTITIENNNKIECKNGNNSIIVNNGKWKANVNNKNTQWIPFDLHGNNGRVKISQYNCSGTVPQKYRNSQK
jgi:hypothetical protein